MKPALHFAAPRGFLRSIVPLFIFLLIAGFVFAQEPVQGEPEKDDPLARQKYLEELRGADTGIPPGARAKALREMDEMFRQEGQIYQRTYSGENSSAAREFDPSIAGSSPTSSQWLFIGPQPTNTTFTSGNASGRVTALVVDPNDATGNTVYLGAAQGGVWKTTNAGVNWTALTDSQASLAIGSLAIDSSTNPSTIYAGTGEPGLAFDSYYGAGVLKSADGGATWTQLGANIFGGPLSGCVTGGNACGGAFIGGLAVRPGGANPATLLAAVNLPFGQGGIYRTTDGGTTWSLVLALTSGFSVGYATNLIAYAGMDGNGIYKSVDGGATWAAANGTGANIITTSGTGRVEFGIARADASGNTVYASVSNPSSTGTLSGFYRTVDGGANWTKLGPAASPGLADFCSPQCWYDMTVAVNPTNSNIVFVGGSAVAAALSKSTTAGATWTAANSNIHVDHHASAFTPDGTKLYWGNDGGAYKTTDTGTGSTVAWTNLNNTLGTIQFYSYFALHPTNINITFAGAQDNGTQKYDGTQALSSAWSNATCGDGAGAVIDVFATTNVFNNCQNIDIRKSTTSGTSFASSISGITTSDRVTFIPPMVGDSNPSGTNALYFGTFRVYQSTNSATSWSAISGDLTGGASTISNMAVAPSDINTMYAATRDGRIWKGANLKTGNCAVTLTCFTNVTGTGLIASRRINAVAISPTDPNVVYVGQSGFSGGSTQHISKTTTGGNTWVNISSNLPDAPINDIVVDPDIPGTLYVANDIGVFRSQDDGASWTTLANGLPRVTVYGLKLHKATRTLRAATHGRGFWDLSVPVGAPAAALGFSSASLTFSSQGTGTTSAGQTVTLTANNGAVNSISVSAATGDFSQTNNCAATLAQNATCTVTVTFSPTAAGTRTGAVTITSSGAGSPQTISLTGTGILPALGLSSNSLTFTNQVTNTTSTGQTVTLTANNGSIGSISVSAASGDFSQTNNCAATLAQNATCTVTVTFTPTATGTRTGAITITSTGNGSPQTINLTGTGTLPPALGLSSASLTYTNQVTNTTSTGQTVTLTANNGSVPGISIGAATGDYSQTNNCTATLAQNATCTVTVTFTPTAAGTRTGAVTITSSGAGSPQTINLSGTGVLPPALGLSSASLNYTSQVTNTTSAGQTVTLTANNGSVTGISVGAATGDFSRTTTCATTLTQNSTCTVTVTFTPTAAGTRTGAVTITSSGTGSPQTINLSGTGVLPPALGASSGALTYTNQVTNTTSIGQTVTLTANNGSVTGISIGAATGDFSQTNDCTATLIQNATCTITVTFTPTAVGTRTGAVTVTSSGAGSPQTISLTGTGILPPALGLSTASLTYTNQVTNTTSTGQTVTLTANNGSVTGISVGAATGDYSQTNNCTATLAQNATCTITVTFTPTAAGTRTGGVTITSSGTGSPQTINLSGTGVLPPALGFSTASLTYTNQVTNTTSTGQTVTLTANNGSVTGISVAAATGDFSRTTTCAATLTQNSTCTVTVTFTPTAAGTRTGAVTITSSGTGSPQTINLTGTGILPPALGLSSSSLTYTNQVTNTTSTGQTVTLTANNGSVTGISIGSASGDYSQTNDCTATLVQNATCTVTVTFTPTAAGTRTGAVTITSSGTGSPQTINLSGTGILPPALGLSSGTLTYTNQVTNTTSTGQTVTLTANNGSVTGISIGAATGDYSQTNNCTVTLTQNSTCTVTITFTPTAAGTRTGAVTITSSGTGSPQTISLTGTGILPPALGLSSASLTYTNQVTSTTSAGQTVTLTANNGTVTGISIGAATGDFSQTNNCAATLVQNATCTITVTFTPTAAGTRTGAVTITSSGTGSPQTISLSGTGVLPAAPALGLSPPSVTFASQVTNTTSGGQAITLTANNGSVSSISISAATGDFSQSNNCAATLAQNSTCTVTVTFTPTAAGPRSGAITITSSGSGSPQSINLDGTGVLPPALGLSSASLTYTNQVTNTTSTGQTVTLTANNGIVTGISVAAATGDYSQTNNCPATLALNSTCTVTVTFTPTAAGTRTGGVTITSSGTGSPQAISLTGTGILPPALGLSTGSLTYTNQVTNTTSTGQTVTLTANNGTVTGISVAAATGDFSRTTTCAATLTQNSTCTVTVTFTPTAAGTRTGAVTITSSGTGSPQTISLSGTGVLPPALGTSSGTLTYANQVTNTTSTGQTVTLTANNGSVTGISIGAATGDFAQTNDCTATLAQGSTCTVTVTFTPTAAGTRTGAVTITSSGAGSPQTINLTGTGILPPALGLSSSTLTYTNQVTNTTSTGQTVTLTASNGSVTGISISAATGDYSQTNNCTATLVLNATCTITVTFTPTATGTRTGAVTITSSGTGSPQTIDLTGTGVLPPALGFSTASLTYTNQVTNTTSTGQTVTLTANNGAVTGISVGAATGDFSRTTTCTATLTQNSTCTVTVTFTPTAAGARTGGVVITSSGTGSPQTISLSGTGVLPPVLGLSSSSLTYTNQVTNTTSTGQTVTLTANNGSVTGISIAAATGDFSRTTTCTATLAQNATCTINVTFTPTAAGTRTGSVAITSSGAGSPQAINMSGTGILPPALGLSSSTLTYTNQVTSTTSTGQAVTVTANNGSVTGISVSAASGDFSQTNDCTATLAQSSTCTVTVTFTPTAAGPRTGAVTITSSGTGSPQTINLSGTGILPPALGFSQGTLTFANQVTNTTSSSQGMVITANNGTVTGISVSGATGDFLQTNNCTATLTLNSTCTVTVTFTPTTTGTRTGAITVTSSGTGSPQTINLTGTGVLPPAVGLSSSALTFSNQNTGSTSAGQTVTLTANNGAISGIAISAATGDFTRTTTCTATLALNATCTVTVTFSPTAAGTRTGAITITSSGSGSPQTVSLTGTGTLPPALGLSPGSLTFSNQVTNTTSTGQTITLTANNGAISGISVAAATGDFSRTTTCTATLAQNSTCTVTVTFAPTAAGTRTGAVTITSSGAGSPQTINLSGTGTLPASLGFSPTSLGFVTQTTNTTSAAQAITVTASNGAVIGLVVSAATGDFSQTNNCPASLPIDNTCTINVTFTPAAAGTRNGSITITSSGVGSPQTINLTGTGIQPAIGLSVGTLTFSNQTTGTTSAGQTVTLTANNGAINGISISAATGDFSQSNNCGATLALNSTCTITVAFSPTAAGTRTGAITITSSGAGSPQTIGLTGFGVLPTIGISPSSVVFGSQLVTTTSPAQTVTLTALNGAISGIAISAAMGDFSRTTTCASTLGLNSTCTISITFSPTATGTRTGTIIVTSSGSGSPQTINLSGNGVVTTTLGFSPTSLTFPSQAPATSSASQTITVTANGGNISNIAVSVASGDFSRTTTCGTTLTQTSSCSITVTFTPTATGARNGAISVTSSGSGSPQTINLSGTGAQPSLGLSTNALLFGSQTTGTTSTSQLMTITANSGSVSGISVSVNGDFSQSNTCPSTLAQGNSCTVSVAFTPTAAGTRSGAVTVASSGAGSPQTVVLSGTGVLPASVGLSPNSLTFGSQALNSPSAAQVVTLTANNGAISGISIAAATGDFGRTTTCAATLAQNTSCTITVAFTPTAVGTRTGAIAISSSGFGSPQTISLSGTGQDPLLLLPGPLTFSQIIGRQTAPQTVTFFNLSGSTLNVSNVSVSGEYTQSNNCGTLANNAICTVAVSFSALGTGARNGLLTLTTSAGTRTLALNGTGVDFTLTLGRPARPTRAAVGSSNVVVAGQAASFELQLGTSVPINNEMVALECTGAPRGASCRVEPSMVVLQSAASVKVVVQTSPYSARSARLGGGFNGTPAGNYSIRVSAHLAGQVRTTEVPIQVKASR